MNIVVILLCNIFALNTASYGGLADADRKELEECYAKLDAQERACVAPMKAIEKADFVDIEQLRKDGEACLKELEQNYEQLRKSTSTAGLQANFRKLRSDWMAIDYARLPVQERRMVHYAVEEMFDKMIIDEGIVFRDSRMAIEVCLLSLRYFEVEGKRCQLAHESLSKSDPLWAQYGTMAGGCDTAKAKLAVYLEIPGMLAESYCANHPKEKEDLAERIKQRIGKYPEWYQANKK